MTDSFGGHRIPSRYVQIALTYTTPWPLRIWFVLTAVYLGCMIGLHKLDYGGRFAVLFIGGSLASWGGPIITSHAKEQMADWRSRLMPRYRTPHLLVAALLFLLSVVGIGWFVVFRLQHIPVEPGWPSIPVTPQGYLAVILLATAVLAWMTHSQSVLFIFLTLGSTATVMIPGGKEIARQVIVGEQRGMVWAVIAGSTLALVALWWRMARMHEEMVEYWKVDTFNSRLRVSMTGDRYMRRAAALEASWFSALVRGAERLDRVTNISAAGFWRRVGHWRLVVENGRANWVLSLLLTVGLLTVYHFAVDHTRPTQIGLLIFIPALLSLLAPSLMATFNWPLRWFALAGESLRPVGSRTQFLREQAAAKAMELANLWFWFTLGAFLPGLILRPTWILSLPVAGTIVLIASAQFFLFGVAVWVLRLRQSIFINFAVMVISLGAAGGLVASQMGNEKQELSQTPSPFWAVVMIVVGLSLTLDAYRRWKVTDLD